MLVYVAFSIHGTNQFLVATKNIPDFDFNRIKAQSETARFIGKASWDQFVVVKSRRPSHIAEREGYKLHWSGLTSRTGNPYVSPPMVLARFRQLQKAGWKLHNVDEFIAKHWKKNNGGIRGNMVSGD